MSKTLAKNILLPVLSVVGLIAIWHVAAYLLDVELILPTPREALVSLGRIVVGEGFLDAVGSTLYRGVIGFVIALLFAVLLSVASGLWHSVDRLVSPVIAILRAVPTISIILISLVWMSSKTAPVLIGFLIIFPSMYSTILTSIKGVDGGLVEMSRLYGVSRRDMLRGLYLPSVLPTLTDSAAAAVSLNVKVVIASEVLAQTNESIGIAMQQSKAFLDTPALMAWTVVAVAMSFALEYLMRAIGNTVMRRCYGAN